MTMDVNGREFEVLRLLGKGKGGYSYLVRDGKERFVLKQIHHEPCDYYQFGDKLASEMHDYAKLSRIGIAMPQLFDVDHEQERILKEYIDGPTVFELVRDGGNVDECLDQVKQMCHLLYANGTNIDYFPTNFVLGKCKLFYIDYECNQYMQQWDFERWGIKYWSRTPEFEAYLNSK